MTRFSANIVGMSAILASLDEKPIKRGFDIGMTRAAKRAGTWINRRVRVTYNIKARDIRKALKVVKKANATQRRELQYRSGLIGIEKFSAREKTVRVTPSNLKPTLTKSGRVSKRNRTVKRKQVTYLLRKDKGRQVSEQTFLINQKRGDGSTAKIAVRRKGALKGEQLNTPGRDRSGRVKKGRLPTTRVQGHAVSLAVRNKSVVKDFNREVQPITRTEIVRAVNNELRKAKSKR